MFVLSIIRFNLSVISSHLIHESSNLTPLRKKLTGINPEQAIFCKVQEFLSADAGIIGTDDAVDTPTQSHGRRRQVIPRVSPQITIQIINRFHRDNREVISQKSWNRK